MKSNTLKKFSLLSSLLLLPIMNVNASISGYTTGSSIKVRTGPGTNYGSVTMLSKNVKVDLVDETKYRDESSDCNSGWYKINYESNERYVCSDYISIGEQSSSTPSYNTASYSARINENGARARDRATTNGSVMDTLLLGTNVTVTGSKISGSGCSDGWYPVTYYGSKNGYVCSSYVTILSEITSSDSEYEKILEASGFPRSYFPYLNYLHKMHPTWTFKAVNTGLDWNASVEGESRKNYIQSTNDAYRVDATLAEAGGWYTAKDSVVAYYLDPRNFLYDKYIFMFEKLSYDSETQTPDAIKGVLGSSYLSGDEYVGYFLNAASSFNVSPVHLAARIVQEGTSGSSSAGGSGNSGLSYNGHLLNGFYNYYNIGSYADSKTSSPVTRGLAYAAGLVGGDGKSYNRPWDTREKAIINGAKIIAESYISVGQYTLYFQKFNTSPTSIYSKYAHQYMTNIQAPATEGNKTYNSYKKADLLDKAFTFEIPVYNNMPDVVSLPSIGSANNYLNEIKINDVNISDFDRDRLSYDFYISNELNSINVNATASDSKSSIDGLGNINIEGDNKNIQIIVKSENGDVRTYSINIIKVNNNTTISQIVSGLSVKTTGNFMNNISPLTDASTLIKSIQKISPNSMIKYTDVNGNELNTTSNLGTGNKLTIKSPSGENVTYTIVVNGDNTGDGRTDIYDLLRIQKHILNDISLTDAYGNASDNNGDGKIDITDLLRVQKYILGDLKL